MRLLLLRQGGGRVHGRCQYCCCWLLPLPLPCHWVICLLMSRGCPCLAWSVLDPAAVFTRQIRSDQIGSVAFPGPLVKAFLVRKVVILTA